MSKDFFKWVSVIMNILLSTICVISISQISVARQEIRDLKENAREVFATKADVARIEGGLEDNDELMKHLLNNLAKGVHHG